MRFGRLFLISAFISLILLVSADDENNDLNEGQNDQLDNTNDQTNEDSNNEQTNDQNNENTDNQISEDNNSKALFFKKKIKKIFR